MKLLLQILFLSFLGCFLFSTTSYAVEGVVIHSGEQEIDFFSNKRNAAGMSQLLEPSFPKLSFGVSNLYFTNVVRLQYQNSILRTLIERQRQDKGISDSFQEMGIPYTPTAPKRTICAELPLNDLCNRFYPDLYEPAVDDLLTDLSLDDIAGKIPSSLKQSSVEAGADEKTQSKAAPKKRDVFASYEWADISCVKGDCRATLIKDNQERITVTPGFVLLGDNVVVKEISFNKVVLSNVDGETKNILPALAPEKGGQDSPLLNTSLAGKSSRSASNDEADKKPAQAEEEEFDFSEDVDVDELLEGLTETDSLSDILILQQ